ncbi:hypothetical protein JAAARDRAFT_145966 [Jaapia argillacea MUCL 33604]|uniref:F-box domain-containing protein n=1 Tax=Jaapia argillacea MUCL 33604 TaxID=933084 RepID=A0A067QCW5_9AGAM|nr:hypothetical protein JAAARDRAFT_145966 [Jaapia argillacea MUCL 33604]
MSLSTLPFELLDGICQNLCPADLVSLARTSSWLCPASQRFLYRHVSVSPWARNISVVATLAKRRDIAATVRSFSIVIDDGRTSPFPAFYQLLARALSGMTRLTSLSLLIDPNASWVLDSSLGTHTTYHHLRHFTCSFPLDSHVAHFLAETPTLIELQVDSAPTSSHHPCASLPSTSIPNLNQFIGSATAAKEIVPGRPVETVHLYNGELTEESIGDLARSTAPIAALGAMTRMAPVTVLDTLARHIPSIAYLRLMAVDDFSVLPTSEFYEQVAAKLAGLPELSTFELCGIHWGSFKRDEGHDRRVWQAGPLSSVVVPERDGEESNISTDDFLVY